MSVGRRRARQWSCAAPRMRVRRSGEQGVCPLSIGFEIRSGEGFDAVEFGAGHGDLALTVEVVDGGGEQGLGPVVLFEIAGADQAEHKLDLLNLLKVGIVPEKLL